MKRPPRFPPILRYCKQLQNQINRVRAGMTFNRKTEDGRTYRGRVLRVRRKHIAILQTDWLYGDSIKIIPRSQWMQLALMTMRHGAWIKP